MTKTSVHYFGQSSEFEDAFSIEIIESLKEDYGLFVWPCSIVLAEYVWQQRLRFSGASVVELGAGTSLPGLVAARVGSVVTLTDDSNRVEVLFQGKNLDYIHVYQGFKIWILLEREGDREMVPCLGDLAIDS